MTITDGLYIDAVIVKGSTKTFSVSINQRNEEDTGFEPFDLSDYAIRFSVLGSPVADGDVMIEHIITTNTTEEEGGCIDDPTNGEFTFTITAQDTNNLGLGKFPVKIEILDGTSLVVEHVLTEGNENGEFNAIRIVEV